MRFLDFSSWQNILVTIGALALITLMGVGIRLLVMQTIQVRRQLENRQINERPRTLIAAYKTLGGSFTGRRAAGRGGDRSRRIRDAVEAALEVGVKAAAGVAVVRAAVAEAWVVVPQPLELPWDWAAAGLMTVLADGGFGIAR